MRLPTTLNLILFLLLLVGVLPSFAAKNKKNVCSITINSNDEIELFKKSLSANDFNFLELTLAKESEEGSKASQKMDSQWGGKVGWLRESCRQGISCDILVISGHFGGGFFGSSNIHLSLEDLEKASCDSTCSGILNNPKEVFLFGCNTLAGKNIDHRTPEEYVRVLINDGFSREQAQQIAAFRYSPLGSSFSDRMSRVFATVPRIYGFSSVAPSGKNVAPFLRDYLRTSGPTYFDYLANISNETNFSLKDKFRSTALKQVTGAKKENAPVCYIGNENLSQEKRLSYIATVLSQGGALELAPYLYDYFANLKLEKLTEKEIEIYQNIQSNMEAKAKLRGFVERAIDGLVKPQVDVLNVMLRLKWLTSEEYEQGIYNIVLKPFYESAIVSLEIKDQICALGIKVDHIKLDQIKPKNWDNSYFLSALECLNPRNPELLNEIVTRLSATVVQFEEGNVTKDLYSFNSRIKSMFKMLSKAKFLDKNLISIVQRIANLHNSEWNLIIQQYVQTAELDSVELRKVLMMAWEKSVGLKKPSFSVYESVLFLGRNDLAFLKKYLEDALTETEYETKSKKMKHFQFVISKSLAIKEFLNFELKNATNPFRRESVLLFMSLAEVKDLTVMPFLAEIVRSDDSLTTRMLSLNLLKKWSGRNVKWSSYFKSLYKSKVHYQLRQLALEAWIESQKEEEEILNAIILEEDLSFKEVLEVQGLKRINYDKYMGLPLRSGFLKYSNLVKQTDLSDILFVGSLDMQGMDSSELSLENGIIGLNKNVLINAGIDFAFTYGFKLHLILLNKIHKKVLVMLDNDELYSMSANYNSKSKVLVIMNNGRYEITYPGVYVLNSDASAVAADITVAMDDFTKRLQSIIESEKRQYKEIIEENTTFMVSLVKVNASGIFDFSFESSMRRSPRYLAGNGKVQLSKNSNGKYEFKILQKKVLQY